MLEITKIEKELIKLSKSEKKKWQEIAILLIKVRENKLYISRSEETFSGWLNKLAESANLHPSGFWRFLSAGSYYLEKTGKDLDALESIGISAHKLELVKKISELDQQIELELFEKVTSDNVTVKELRDQFEILRDGLTSLEKKRTDMNHLVESFKNILNSANTEEYKKVASLFIEVVQRLGNRQILDEVLAELDYTNKIDINKQITALKYIDNNIDNSQNN